MRNTRKRNLQDAAKDIDQGLNGLFGVLSDAIGEMVSRLEDGTSGAVERGHVIETAKGPVQAHAGIKLRMGGLDIGSDAKAETAPTRPVNPNRKASATAAPSEAIPLSYDLIEDDDAWVMTADVPGVAKKDIKLEQQDHVLDIRTIGSRRYAAQVDLAEAFDVAAIQQTLRNGILTLRVPKGSAS